MAYRDSTSATLGTAGTSITINVPAATQNGDVMLLFIYTARSVGPAIYSTPSGWTEVASTADITNAAGDETWIAYWRVASSEPASYTPTWDITARAVAIMESHSGIDTSDPFLSFMVMNPGWRSGDMSTTAPRVAPVPLIAATDLDQTAVWLNASPSATGISISGGYTLDQSPGTGGSGTAHVQMATAHKDFSNSLVPPITFSMTSGNSASTTISIAWRRSGITAGCVRSVTWRLPSASDGWTITRPPAAIARDGDLAILIFGKRSSPYQVAGRPSPNWVPFMQPFGLNGSNNCVIMAYSKTLDSGDGAWPFTFYPGSSASAVIGLLVMTGLHPANPIGGLAFSHLETATTSWPIDSFAMGTAAVPGAAIIGWWAGATTTAPSDALGTFEGIGYRASGGVTQMSAGFLYKQQTAADVASDTWSLPNVVPTTLQMALLQSYGAPGFRGARGITSIGVPSRGRA